MWFSTSRSRKIGHVEIDIELRAKWPPNHKFGTISLAGATDADGDLLTWNVAGVTQDEPTNGLGALEVTLSGQRLALATHGRRSRNRARAQTKPGW